MCCKPFYELPFLPVPFLFFTGETGTGKRKKVTKISQFQALEEDIKQLKAYEAEWKKQHPYPGNKSFLVYCFGNQGYRVFPIFFRGQAKFYFIFPGYIPCH